MSESVNESESESESERGGRTSSVVKPPRAAAASKAGSPNIQQQNHTRNHRIARASSGAFGFAFVDTTSEGDIGLLSQLVVLPSFLTVQ